MPFIASRGDGGIEGRHINHTHAVTAAVAIGHFNDLGFYRRVVELDFIAHNFHDLAGGTVGFGADGELDHGAFGAADFLDDFFQFHVHDIHGRGIALGHRQDAILLIQFMAFRRRAAGDE